MGKTSPISPQQRCRIVVMMLRKEESIAVPARRYNVSEAARYRRRDDFRQAREAVLSYGRGQSKSNGPANRSRHPPAST